jgi:hypothetical protein
LPVSEPAVLSSIRLSESDCGVSLTLGQHNKPRSITAFKAAVIRVVAILIGILLSLVAYYNPFGEGWGGNRLEAQSALFGLVFIVGPIWFWVRDWKRSKRR